METGGVRCWGNNNQGQLGDGTTIRYRWTPPASDVLTGVRAIAVGGDMYGFTCALMETGGVRCWGYNYDGQLGDGTTIAKSTPPTSDVLTGVRAVTAGTANTCALMDTGGLRCWGSNNSCVLGIGANSGPWTPPTSDVLMGVQAVATGNYHTCALMETGGVRCWGADDVGQLGDGGPAPSGRLTPVLVAGTCE